MCLNGGLFVIFFGLIEDIIEVITIAIQNYELIMLDDPLVLRVTYQSPMTWNQREMWAARYRCGTGQTLPTLKQANSEKKRGEPTVVDTKMSHGNIYNFSSHWNKNTPMPIHNWVLTRSIKWQKSLASNTYFKLFP